MSQASTRKILITGATGYIGSYTSRILAATHPRTTVYALSRAEPETARVKNPKMAQFDNIVFVKGDCLQEDGIDGARDVMSEVDSVVHMVGSITDSFNYKKVLQTFGDFDKMQNCAKKTLSSP